MFGFSDAWQLVINTGTTIITILNGLLDPTKSEKGFPSNSSETKRARGFHGASNRLICAENLTEDELKAIHQHYTTTLIELAKADEKITQSHSVEEANERHERKVNRRKVA